LKYYYRSTFPKKNGKCFHVIGIDILIDEALNPWLLESNNNPSFNIEHEPCGGA
jgi:D-alanine-D-alanine ligase-like ATP-grasp enzyme